MASPVGVNITATGDSSVGPRRHDPMRAFRDLVELIAFRRAPLADDTAERAVLAVPALVELVDVQLDCYLAAVSKGLEIERRKNDVLQIEYEAAIQRVTALEADLSSMRASSQSRIQTLEAEVRAMRSQAARRLSAASRHDRRQANCHSNEPEEDTMRAADGNRSERTHPVIR